MNNFQIILNRRKRTRKTKAEVKQTIDDASTAGDSLGGPGEVAELEAECAELLVATVQEQ